jgi:hypothetical protein
MGKNRNLEIFCSSQPVIGIMKSTRMRKMRQVKFRRGKRNVDNILLIKHEEKDNFAELGVDRGICV